MRKITAFFMAVLISVSCVSFFTQAKSPEGYIVITDYVEVNSGRDVADAVQRVIDENPHRTIYFPDGEYLVSKPILTPAEPRLSVSLKLSDYAVIKAIGDWTEGEAVVQLGATHQANDILTVGSNYCLEGGYIDGSYIADGVSINGGRETAVRNVNIKHTIVGLHIFYGTNSGSSDCDISGVNITGNGQPNSIGFLVEGYDNTITNSRIFACYYGMYVASCGNCFRNIHPLFFPEAEGYTESCGFYDRAGENVYDYCYADQYGIAFRTTGNFKNRYNDCFCYWYTERGESHTAFKADRQFNSLLTNFRPDMPSGGTNYVLKVGVLGGTGKFVNPVISSDDRFENFIYKIYEYNDRPLQPVVRLLFSVIYFIPMLVKTIKVIF